MKDTSLNSFYFNKKEKKEDNNRGFEKKTNKNKPR